MDTTEVPTHARPPIAWGEAWRPRADIDAGPPAAQRHRHVSVQLADVSPADARRILETERWERQRPLRPWTIAAYKAGMERGEFIKLTLEFAQLPDGTRWLVDGQHRLGGMIEAGITLPAVITTTHVQTAEDIAHLFATFDNPVVRSAADSLRASGVAIDTGVSDSAFNRLAGAAAIVECNFSRDFNQRTKSRVLRQAIADTWRPTIKAYVGLFQGTRTEAWKVLLYQPTAAVALLTVRDQPEKAAVFWGGIARNDGLRANDHRAVLLEWLRNHKVDRDMHAILFCRYVAHAWNAWYRGRDIGTRLAMKNKTGPIVVDGCDATKGRTASRAGLMPDLAVDDF